MSKYLVVDLSGNVTEFSSFLEAQSASMENYNQLKKGTTMDNENDYTSGIRSMNAQGSQNYQGIKSMNARDYEGIKSMNDQSAMRKALSGLDSGEDLLCQVISEINEVLTKLRGTVPTCGQATEKNPRQESGLIDDFQLKSDELHRLTLHALGQAQELNRLI